MTTPSYETDFYAWTQAQVALLRDKQWAAVDLDHVIEEIESLGHEQAHAVESHLSNLCRHLLKWRYQPSHRTPSWRRSMINARQQMARRLRRNPSLWPQLPTLLIDAYRDALRAAADETGLPEASFPETCPWTLEQLQDEDFRPEA